MKKNEWVKYMGLTKYDKDIIKVSSFDVPQNEVIRDIYIDGRGDEWAWLWGEGYRVKRSGTYGYVVVRTW